MDGVNDLQYANAGDTTVVADNPMLTKFKKHFAEAVESGQKWRDEAKEDLGFYTGREQWRSDDKRNLEDHQRPAITVNRIKPLLNLLSGYQRLNRYDIEFLPRTNDDVQLADVRKGVTKYIMDRSQYDNEESDAFFDAAVMGIGWLEVGYKFDWSAMDGDAFIRRVAPFNIYIDPESRDKYFRDMQFVVRARWVSKEELAKTYPEHKEEIEAQTAVYLSEEEEYKNQKLWWQKETEKIRLAEYWYKKTVKKKLFLLNTGETVFEVTPEMIAMQMVVQVTEAPVTEIWLMSFFDNVVLEHIESPYEHGEFPFVPVLAYYQGDDDIPAGVVRDLKDPQREINKRRSQELHILNTQCNGGWIVEEGAMTPEQESNLRSNASTPGAIIKTANGALRGGSMQRLEPQGLPAGAINATQEAMAELPQISGINEALMGTDISNQSSGRAIELKQKQAITHIASLFDNLRYAKKRIAFLLWGKRGAKGIVPQFYTDEKTYRIVGPNGHYDFITVNQQQQQFDAEKMQVIQTTLNDLSQGEFDIVVSDTPATTTQRTAQFWSLVDACSKLGINGNMVLDILLDLSDVAQKDEIKKRLQQEQQQQAQAAQQQQQVQLEIEKQKKLSRSMAYKDLQLPLQLALAAEAGIFPKQYADAFMQWSIQQYAQQMGIPMQAQQMMMMQGQAMPGQQITPGNPQAGNPQGPAPQPQVMTQAAMRGMVEANKPVL